MLSLFPTLLTFDGLGPFFIRLALGFTLAYFGYQKTIGKGQSSGSNSRAYGIIEMIVAALIIVGLFTQLAALINAIILLIKLGHKIKDRAFLTNGVNYYLILLTMAISLIFTGAGFLALDLPL